MKVKFFLASLVFFFALLSSFVSCSLGRDEGTVKIAIPSRSALSRSRNSNSAARAVDGEYISIFIVGDYEDKKTVPFIDDETAQTVTFDSIPAGASVRVVCTWNFSTNDPEDDNRHLGCIGVSDEIVIVGGTEQAATVVMNSVCLDAPAYEDDESTNYVRIRYSNDDYDIPANSGISLPGECYYRFSFSNSGGTTSYKTSVPYHEHYSSPVYFAVSAEIFYGDTRVLYLYVPYEP
ncbi:MAG: hypothetical protein IKQ13_08700 [Treponema sp.]|nr:hypothetical protein [Treponema sp.]